MSKSTTHNTTGTNNAGFPPAPGETHQKTSSATNSKKDISEAETATMIRRALKEAFPKFKFSVRTSKYSMGSCIYVYWTDGPNPAQVEAVTGRFSGSYFDGMIDYKGSVYHMIDGVSVSFAADSIHCNRSYSRPSIERAIDRVYAKYEQSFARDKLDKPSVHDFQNGNLYRVQLSGLHHEGNQSVQQEIHSALRKHSDRLKVNHSPTAARVMIVGDDGYSKSTGGGQSVVDTSVCAEPSLAEQVTADVLARFTAR
jgi:hypothetical protein